MIQQTGQSITAYGYFVEGQVGKTGLTVTCNVRGVSNTLLVTGGSATEVGDGWYEYTLSGASTGSAGNYKFTFKTATTTVNQRDVPALWVVGPTWVQNLDAVLTTSFTAIPAAVWAFLSASATTANSIGKRIVDYLTGDVYGRVGAPAGASLSADIAAIFARLGAPAGASQSADIAAVKAQTALIQAKTDTIPVGPATEANVNLRMLATSYTAPDNAGIGTANANIVTLAGYVDTEVAAIKAKTDLLTFTGSDLHATLDNETVTVGANNDKDGYSLATDPPTAVENAAAILAATVEDEATVAQSLRGINAALMGKLAGAEPASDEQTVRDLADTKDRLVFATDEFGNRTTVTRDLD